MPTTDKPLPPGRFGLPWIGETMSIVRSNHGFYTDRFERYGPVFRTRLFGNNFVVFSGHEAFHRFATDPAIERGGADPISVEQIFLKSLALVDGPEHRRRKQVMLEGIRTWEAIEAYVSRMQALTEQCVDPWVASGTATAQPDLQLLAARFTAALYTGDPSEAHAREISEVVADMREAFMTLPVPLPGTAYGRAIKARDRLIEIIDEAIASHQKGDFDDIVSRMLSAAEADGVPVESLRGDLLHLIFAGQGGFFVPLTLITLALGEHEDIQARAREEVLEIVPEGPVTLEHLARMRYLDRLAREVRRHYAMNSATFFGRVKEPMEVAGYHIPRGWGAIGAIHITMRNAEEYEDPTRFDPDRFLPERMAARPPGSYVPHGDGDRGGHRCPGEDIVGTAIQLYLAVLLRRARYSLPPQDLTLTNTLFPLPRSGLVLRVQPLEGGG